MNLSSRAARLVRQYTAGLAKANGIESTHQFFSLTDPRETQLRDALLENSEFLRLVNWMAVDQLQGQVVNTGNPGLYTGRVKGGRFSKQMGVSGNEYKLVETDSGSALAYDMLTVWANAGSEEEFFQRIQAFSAESFALDMLRVAFNGESIAETTDPEAYPLGQDVNRGWHTIVKERSPEQIISDGVTLDRLGSGADFVSLDAAVTDLIHSCIHEAHRRDPRLVVLVSADLIAADATSMMNRIDRPTEKVAAQLINREIAGRTAYTPPFMPDGRLIVTTLSNLHIYTQRNTQFRRAEWVDDRKQFENNFLRMEGFAVEHDELYAAFDNVIVGSESEEEPTEE